MFSLLSANGGVFGEDVLNLSVIAGAVFLLLASLWTVAEPLPGAATVAAQPAIEQVVVVAHSGRIS